MLPDGTAAIEENLICKAGRDPVPSSLHERIPSRSTEKNSLFVSREGGAVKPWRVVAVKRYHIKCAKEPLGSGWTVESEPGSDHFSIAQDDWRRTGTFVVADSRGRSPTEARARRTWRHRMFDLFRSDELVAVVRTSLRSGIRAEFVWEMPGPDVLELRGEFEDMNFRFVRGERTVGVVSTLEEQDGIFCVEVLPCEDQSLILAVAVAVRFLCAESLGMPNLPRTEERVGVPSRLESMESEVRVAG